MANAIVERAKRCGWEHTAAACKPPSVAAKSPAMRVRYDDIPTLLGYLGRASITQHEQRCGARLLAGG